MTLRLVTKPANLAVSLAEAKAHLRVDHSDDDVAIEGLIEAATSHLDGRSGILGRCMVSQTWSLDMAGFPPSSVIRIDLDPVLSITSITYFDRDNVSQTLPTSVYGGVYIDAFGPYLSLKSGQSWPESYCRPDAVSVTFVTGFGDPAQVPPALKQAMKLLIGHWYANRELSISATLEMPFAVSALIAPFRRQLI